MLIRYPAFGSRTWNRRAAQDYRFEGSLLSPVDFGRQEAR